MKIKTILFICLMTILFAVSSINAEPLKASGEMTLYWEAVTVNSDKTPCTDLAGYAIYRSTESENWDDLTGERKAYISVSANELECIIINSEEGLYYWIVRAFDTTGNYAGASNEIATIIDLSIPDKIQIFIRCQ